jgi:hypothetical protein
MRIFSRSASTGLYFAVVSVAMTTSTAFVIWFGHGGHPPLTIADAYIYFAEWPMVLLHGIDFDVFSGESIVVNMLGWGLVGLLHGALFSRFSK